MTGIAEMFAELSGYDRYWMSIAIRGAYVLAIGRDRRAVHRDRNNAKLRERYWNVPGLREQRLEAQRRYDEQRRIARGIRRKPAQHGTHSKYCGGCRCDACRAATAAYQRERYARRAA